MEENEYLLLLLFLLLAGRGERIRSRQKQNGKDLGARQKKSCKKYWREEEKIMVWAVGVGIIAGCLTYGKART